MSVILEGCDGTGKTTLGQYLQNEFPNMEMHPRFCASKTGPIENLAEAVYKDNLQLSHFIYDRHPVVSEYVYNFAIPTRQVNPQFLTESMGRLRSRVASNNIMIWCIPPLETVLANIVRDRDEQMPGVEEYAERIYQQYQYQRLVWPGHACTFDYTDPGKSMAELHSLLNNSIGYYWTDRP